jgi:hypothetical protein
MNWIHLAQNVDKKEKTKLEVAEECGSIQSTMPKMETKLQKVQKMLK